MVGRHVNSDEHDFHQQQRDERRTKIGAPYPLQQRSGVPVMGYEFCGHRILREKTLPSGRGRLSSAAAGRCAPTG